MSVKYSHNESHTSAHSSEKRASFILTLRRKKKSFLLHFRNVALLSCVKRSLGEEIEHLKKKKGHICFCVSVRVSNLFSPIVYIFIYIYIFVFFLLAFFFFQSSCNILIQCIRITFLVLCFPLNDHFHNSKD